MSELQVNFQNEDFSHQAFTKTYIVDQPDLIHLHNIYTTTTTTLTKN